MDSGRTMRVLVVDDDPVLGRMFLDILKMAGHDGKVARSGVEALEMAAVGDYDVLVTDMRMPQMGGLELWQRLKTQCSALASAAIFTSAEPPQGEARQMLESTGLPFLLKPFRLLDFLGLLEQFATSRV